MIEIITEMYKGCRTTIKTSDSKGIVVDILSGVKQGDPLSPLLFSRLYLESLLENIERETSGIKVNDQRKIPVLTFGDDIVLLGEDEREAHRQLDALYRCLSCLGMNISGQKSPSFQVVAKNDTWFIKNTEIKLKNHRIASVDSSSI